MEAQMLAHKYATAVFSQALEKWLMALRMVRDKISSDFTLAQMLHDANHSFSDRQKALDQVIPGDSDQYIKNFFYAMLKSGDIGLLGQVVNDLERMARGGPPGQTVRVTTAYTLAEDEQDKFRQKLRAKYGESLELTFNVDTTIVGGAIIQMGDKVIDGSVATRLESMSNLLGVR